MIRIYAADVTVLSDTRIYESLYKSLPQSRRDKADRYRFASDRYLSLGAGALLKTALESIALDIADVQTDEIGRPYIDGAYFSLSHSGKYALCALSDSCIGADTEQVREFGDTLARRVFSDDELALCRGDDRMHTRLWTAKESVMKFFGKGLSLGAENISLYIEDGRPLAAVYSGKKLHLWNTSHEDYEITICSEQDVFPDDINFMSLDKLV